MIERLRRHPIHSRHCQPDGSTRNRDTSWWGQAKHHVTSFQRRDLEYHLSKITLQIENCKVYYQLRSGGKSNVCDIRIDNYIRRLIVIVCRPLERISAASTKTVGDSETCQAPGELHFGGTSVICNGARMMHKAITISVHMFS